VILQTEIVSVAAARWIVGMSSFPRACRVLKSCEVAWASRSGRYSRTSPIIGTNRTSLICSRSKPASVPRWTPRASGIGILSLVFAVNPTFLLCVYIRTTGKKRYDNQVLIEA
jgi:hypothetical protein